jgi:hypothetical protein
MDDIKMLREARRQPAAPSHAAYSAARAALLERAAALSPAPERMRRSRLPRMGARLVAAGTLTAAAAAATAVIVASGATPPTATPNNPRASVQQSGQQILLAAATTAEARPQGSGTYWYVKTVYTKTVSGKGKEFSAETWTGRDGRSWVRLSPPGTAVVSNDGSNGHWADGFEVGSTELSFGQIQQLPAHPAALKAWIVKHAMGADSRGNALSGALIGLLSSMPAPPKVRAAAFRSLASLPNVKNLGTVDGGQGLLILSPEGEIKLVIDPATSRVRDSSFTGVGAGPKVGGTVTVAAAEWTNQLPKVTPSAKGNPAPQKKAGPGGR